MNIYLSHKTTKSNFKKLKYAIKEKPDKRDKFIIEVSKITNIFWCSENNSTPDIIRRLRLPKETKDVIKLAIERSYEETTRNSPYNQFLKSWQKSKEKSTSSTKPKTLRFTT